MNTRFCNFLRSLFHAHYPSGYIFHSLLTIQVAAFFAPLITLPQNSTHTLSSRVHTTPQPHRLYDNNRTTRYANTANNNYDDDDNNNNNLFDIFESTFAIDGKTVALQQVLSWR